MEQYIIKGGKPLKGEVAISGAKNAALPIIAASIMTKEEVVLENLPEVSDIDDMLEIVEYVGAKVSRISTHSVKICGATIDNVCTDIDTARRIRGSYYMLGALMGRYKKAEVPLPGGCNIGNRPVDQHIKGLEALGATVKIEHGMIKAEADKLIGNHIYLDVASVGATINIMMAAALAEGNTVIENAAREPHVVDVANILSSMGANIKGAGTDVIRIKGVEALHGCNYSIISDQIEAATFMLAAAATKGDVTIKNIIPRHVEAISNKLIEIGAEIEELDDAVRVRVNTRLKSTQVKALFYPGFPTDAQPQMTTVLTLSEGVSIVKESIFENRFKYVDELVKMGAHIRVSEGNTAVVEGVHNLSGAVVTATDLRAGAALIIAALMAEGISIVEKAEYVERGYENMEKKLCALGAIIEKVDHDDETTLKKIRLKMA